MSLDAQVLPLRRAWPVVVPLVVVLLALGWFLAQRLPDTSPRILGGTVSDVVQISDVWVAVDSVRATTQIDSGSGPIETHGQWLVVRLAYQGVDKPARPVDVTWRTADGRRFQQSLTHTSTMSEAQPGQWLVADLVFEVPADAVADGVVRVSPIASEYEIPYAIAELTLEADQIEVVEGVVELMEATWVENSHD